MTAVKDLVSSRSTGGGAVGVEFDTLPLQQHRWVDTRRMVIILSDLLSPQQAAVSPGRVRAGGRGRGGRPAEDGQEQGGD